MCDPAPHGEKRKYCDINTSKLPSPLSGREGGGRSQNLSGGDAGHLAPRMHALGAARPAPAPSRRRGGGSSRVPGAALTGRGSRNSGRTRTSGKVRGWRHRRPSPVRGGPAGRAWVWPQTAPSLKLSSAPAATARGPAVCSRFSPRGRPCASAPHAASR